MHQRVVALVFAPLVLLEPARMELASRARLSWLDLYRLSFLKIAYFLTPLVQQRQIANDSLAVSMSSNAIRPYSQILS